MCTYSLDPHPSCPSELENRVALTASPIICSPCKSGYEDGGDFDQQHAFKTAHVVCVPLIGDTRETIGVLTVLRGWPLSAPPPQHVIWSDAKYAPFSGCVSHDLEATVILYTE